MKLMDSNSLWEERNKQTPLFNPLLKQFECDYILDDGTVQVLEMPAGQITYFPKFKADYMKKHLADEVYNTGTFNSTNSEKIYQEIYDIIEVKNG